jgi:hypothetical protein
MENFPGSVSHPAYIELLRIVGRIRRRQPENVNQATCSECPDVPVTMPNNAILSDLPHKILQTVKSVILITLLKVHGQRL